MRARPRAIVPSPPPHRWRTTGASAATKTHLLGAAHGCSERFADAETAAARRPPRSSSFHRRATRRRRHHIAHDRTLDRALHRLGQAGEAAACARAPPASRFITRASVYRACRFDATDFGFFLVALRTASSSFAPRRATVMVSTSLRASSSLLPSRLRRPSRGAVIVPPVVPAGLEPPSEVRHS